MLHIKIQKLVMSAAHCLSGVSHWKYLTPVFQDQHWLPIDLWMEFKVVGMTYKAPNDLPTCEIVSLPVPYCCSSS